MWDSGLVKGILQEHSVVVEAVLRTLDWLAIAMAGWLAFMLRFDAAVMPGPFQRAMIIALLVSIGVFGRCSVYRAWRGETLNGELRTLLWAWCLTFLITIGALALTTGRDEAPFPRLWLMLWFVLGCCLLTLLRGCLRQVLRRLRSSGHNTRRVVVVVAGELGVDVIRKLCASRWTGLRVVGYFDDRPVERTGEIAGVPRIGRIDELAAYVEGGHADQVWITLPFRAEERVREILETLRHATADIRMVPDILGLQLLNHSMGTVAGIPVINLSSTPMVGFNRVIKALEDRMISLAILLMIAPLMIAIAIGIKLSSPGPVFFRQERLGYDGRPFRVWKFRSMKVHQEHGGQVTQATRGDSRITPFGAFLRRTSLDELPQFFNVLDGSMSIVGPRPHAVAHNQEYKELVDSYMRRHKVKPGITGLAQVRGYRGETDTVDKMKLRVESDLEYIENWSLGLDLKIILQTIFKGFVNPNAY